MNKSINLKQRPVGTPTLADFDFIELENNLNISEGEILLDTRYTSENSVCYFYRIRE